MKTIDNGFRLSRGIWAIVKYVVNIRNTVVASIVIATVAVCIGLFGGTGAFAQGAGACAVDIENFCQGVQPGGGRMAQCLIQHKQQLSPSCKIHIAEVVEQLKEVNQACEDDIMVFCPGVQPGGGRIAQCLKMNKAWLSLECKATIYEVMP